MMVYYTLIEDFASNMIQIDKETLFYFNL